MKVPSGAALCVQVRVDSVGISMAPKLKQQDSHANSEQDAPDTESSTSSLSSLPDSPVRPQISKRPRTGPPERQDARTGTDSVEYQLRTNLSLATADDKFEGSRTAGLVATLLSSKPMRPPAEEREELREQARYHGVLNPLQEMQGIGHCEYLGSYNAALGMRMGFWTPEDLLHARLENQVARHGEPDIVWYPHPGHVNPSEQPPEPGHWEYLTLDDEHEAHINLGGQQDIPMPDSPIAEQIWGMRQGLRGTERGHVTDSIRLLWVPDDLYEPSSDQSTSTDPAQARRQDTNTDADAVETGSEQANTAAANPAMVATGGTLQAASEPTNSDSGGRFDQTGTVGKAEYWATTTAHGTQIVNDRSPAHLGRREAHLLTVYSKKGWLHYSQRDTLDWNDQTQIEKLNQWRRVQQRSAFGYKREGAKSYSPKEIEHLREAARKSGGKRPEEGFKALGQKFGELYGTIRESSSVRRKYYALVEQDRQATKDGEEQENESESESDQDAD